MSFLDDDDDWEAYGINVIDLDAGSSESESEPDEPVDLSTTDDETPTTRSEPPPTASSILQFFQSEPSAGPSQSSFSSATARENRSQHRHRHRRNAHSQHSPPSPAEVAVEQVEVSEYVWSDTTIRHNTAVEYQPDDDRPSGFGGDFLLVKKITISSLGTVSLHGLQLQRNMLFRSALPHKRNEVCLIVRVEESSPAPFWAQSWLVVTLADVISVRTLEISHQKFPHGRSLAGFPSKEAFFQSGMLICRYIRFSVLSFPGQGKKAKIGEGVIRRIVPADVVGIMNYNSADSETVFINESTSSSNDSRQSVASDQDDVADSNELVSDCGRRTGWRTTVRQKFSFGDAFCGAGGASLAARLAGLDVLYGIDHWIDACKTFRLNFPRAAVFMQGVEEVSLKTETARFNFEVDVLHLSPPCQYFSPAHTVEGQGDEANTAALFAVEAMLVRANPRIVTVEETAGLYERHQNFFHQLLGSFVNLDFTVAYKMVNFADYGLVQARKRIVIVATARGVPLPRFPTRTHCTDSEFGATGGGTADSTCRFRQTVLADVLTPVRFDDPLVRLYRPMSRQCLPYNPHTSQLPGCLTTNGGGTANVHPNGLRDFNLREMAQCQSFPDWYGFAGNATSVKRQMGNAVPPVVFRVFFKEVVRTLATFDAFRAGLVGSVRSSRWGEDVVSCSGGVNLDDGRWSGVIEDESVGVIDLCDDSDQPGQSDDDDVSIKPDQVSSQAESINWDTQPPTQSSSSVSQSRSEPVSTTDEDDDQSDSSGWNRQLPDRSDERDGVLSPQTSQITHSSSRYADGSLAEGNDSAVDYPQSVEPRSQTSITTDPDSIMTDREDSDMDQTIVESNGPFPPSDSSDQNNILDHPIRFSQVYTSSPAPFPRTLSSPFGPLPVEPESRTPGPRSPVHLRPLISPTLPSSIFLPPMVSGSLVSSPPLVEPSSPAFMLASPSLTDSSVIDQHRSPSVVLVTDVGTIEHEYDDTGDGDIESSSENPRYIEVIDLSD